MKTNIAELISKLDFDKLHFQKPFATFVADSRFETVVETGSGTSSLLMLEAMDRAGRGKLYSIDPSPMCGYEITHPRYELIKKKSFQSLAELYRRTGPWDLFLHDSDHWFECQTFEYNFGFSCIKKGGWIFADDRTWDYSTVWDEFVSRNKLDQVFIAAIAGAQKTTDEVMDKSKSELIQKSMWEQAKLDGIAHRKANGKPDCWTCGEELTVWWKSPDAK
jgi:predicted O-methyltransferase YrrM